MPSIVKDLAVKDLTADFKDAEGFVVVAMPGLTMVENEAMRSQLAKRGVRMRMVANKLALIALNQCGHKFPRDMFRGVVGVAYGTTEQTIEAAKILVADPELVKAGKVAVRGALLEGNVLEQADARALAEVPSRDELRSKLLGLLNGPARALVTVLAAPGNSVARVVQAHCDQAGGGDAAAEA
jgi:large subunit ribosomal protein L10